MKKYTVTLWMLGSLLLADTYIVPAEYDNVRVGHYSASYGVINNSTPTLSANSYQIGGQSVRYRCLIVPKIECTAKVPSIIPNISEASVKEETTDEVLKVYTTDVRVEDTASDWYVCGAAYAADTSDFSEMSATQDPSTQEVTINYEYRPNEYLESWYAFTDYGGNVGNSSSYMTIEYKQICR